MARLGNLVLLETSSSNRNRANAPYATNQAVQSTATFITTRQAQMARAITGIWRIAQLA